MPAEPPYQLLAEAVLILHFSVVVFVVGGLVLIIVGNVVRWSWVNALWFRLAHIVAITVVVVESWFGLVCPLTTLEVWLRSKSGATIYTTSFVEHWLQQVLFYEAPSWVFMLGYTFFAVLVAAVWWHFPPRSSSHRHERGP